MLLRGPAGTGKSALLEDVIQRADGMLVLRTTGVESEAELPFAALHQLLRPILGHLDALPDPRPMRFARPSGCPMVAATTAFSSRSPC